MLLLLLLLLLVMLLCGLSRRLLCLLLLWQVLLREKSHRWAGQGGSCRCWLEHGIDLHSGATVAAVGSVLFVRQQERHAHSRAVPFVGMASMAWERDSKHNAVTATVTGCVTGCESCMHHTALGFCAVAVHLYYFYQFLCCSCCCCCCYLMI
jgi:hypothetical protein